MKQAQTNSSENFVKDEFIYELSLCSEVDVSWKLIYMKEAMIMYKVFKALVEKI